MEKQINQSLPEGRQEGDRDMKMTKFEKDTLRTLLNMYENELKENGMTFNGDKISDTKVQEFIEEVHEIKKLIGMVDY